MKFKDKKPFELQELDESKRQDTFTVKLNSEQRKEFEELKIVLQQTKDSTAMKQLAFEIAPKVLLDKKMAAILKVVLNNYRKNKRLGIVDFD